MKVVFISGSPRKKSNTDFLLEAVRKVTGGKLVKLSNLRIFPCASCRACVEKGCCVIEDDLTRVVFPEILEADAIVLGSPVYFNNVSAHMKAFMDRTWCLRGRLKNKIGGAVVVGRRYGIGLAMAEMVSFMLKHEMIVANRGVEAIAYEEMEAKNDMLALRACEELGKRILELGTVLGVLRRYGSGAGRRGGLEG